MEFIFGILAGRLLNNGAAVQEHAAVSMNKQGDTYRMELIFFPENPIAEEHRAKLELFSKMGVVNEFEAEVMLQMVLLYLAANFPYVQMLRGGE